MELDTKNVLIIIPTYNEALNIELIIKKIFSLLPDIKILVVDDSSPDDTSNIVENLKSIFSNLFLLKREKKEGLGKAYIAAFKQAFSMGYFQKIVMMDSDFSHDPQYLPVMLAESRYFDVVIGSRYVKGGGVVNWELWRKFLSRFANFYCKNIIGIPISDFTSGFQIIDLKILEHIDFLEISSSGYAFQIELKYHLWKMGASFKEVPIIFRNRIKGESKISNHIIREGIIAPWKIKFLK